MNINFVNRSDIPFLQEKESLKIIKTKLKNLKQRQEIKVQLKNIGVNRLRSFIYQNFGKGSFSVKLDSKNKPIYRISRMKPIEEKITDWLNRNYKNTIKDSNVVGLGVGKYPDGSSHILFIIKSKSGVNFPKGLPHEVIKLPESQTEEVLV